LNVAVTGATGFIGQHVLRSLLRNGAKPTILVRPGSAIPDEFRHIPAACFDIFEPPEDSFDQLGKPAALIHLAWSGLPNYRSLHHFETELPAQFRFLKLLIKAGLPHLVVSGTCFEYGMQSGCLVESMETKPANPYGFAKDALRQQLQYLAGALDFDLTWARFFYLYGQAQSPASLYVQISAAVARGEQMFDMSGGEQIRDYLPVDEAAGYLVNLALGTARPGTVNICSGRPVSVRRQAEEWLAQNHWRIRLNLGVYPYPDYEPLAFWGDRGKLDGALQENKVAGVSKSRTCATPDAGNGKLKNG